MSWRIVVLSLLVVGLGAAPVTAQTRFPPVAPAPALLSDVLLDPLPQQEPEPPILPTPGPSPEPRGSVRAVTRTAAGYTVTVQGGRWPYYPDLPPGLSPAALSDAGLLLDVSIANTSGISMRYSAANFRVRQGDRIYNPDTGVDVQPKLGDGELPGSVSPGQAPSTARGLVNFWLPVPGSLDGLSLDYVPDTVGGIPLPSLSLPLDVVR
jgi:hypothetical protein